MFWSDLIRTDFDLTQTKRSHRLTDCEATVTVSFSSAALKSKKLSGCGFTCHAVSVNKIKKKSYPVIHGLLSVRI